VSVLDVIDGDTVHQEPGVRGDQLVVTRFAGVFEVDESVAEVIAYLPRTHRESVDDV
jgi:hypothetical protein